MARYGARWLAGVFVAATVLSAGCAPDSGPSQQDSPQSPHSSSRSDAAARWRPVQGMTWQWQLHEEPVDQSVDAEVYDIDLFANAAEVVAALHTRGRRAICYLSAGSWEPYRPDSGDFPKSLLGGALTDWPDERWLDIRQLDTLRPLLAARLDLCRDKGFDGVEPDWLDNHQQRTGFAITTADQLRYNRMLADLAHERGLAIGLKNDLDQADELAELYDFAVVEQCAEFDECDSLSPFLDLNKPVFHAEYDLPLTAFCAESRRLGLSSIRKHLDLDAWREVC